MQVLKYFTYNVQITFKVHIAFSSFVYFAAGYQAGLFDMVLKNLGFLGFKKT